MGNVYHGVHVETGDVAAVKVLPASMAREEGFVLRFSREIEALRKLNSPNIVQIFLDGATPDGSYYYSMEFVDGETLTSIISGRKRLPWREVIDISLQIASALKAAHNAGIVHRDLKPSNLMVGKDGVVKLADFGVAHVFATTRLTRTGGVVGTAEYMSPEQARGHRATKHSDLYSLGAVMYAMLTGRPPFTGQLASDILHQHQFSQFDKPSRYVPEIPRLMEEFVCTLLEKKPEKRFPDALVVINKLQQMRSRIEFAEREGAAENRHLDGASSDHTVMGGSDRTQGSNTSRPTEPDFPGAATMVRNVIRDEIDSRRRRGPVAAFFDNTIVLVVLLVMVIVAGYYLSLKNQPDPDQELAQAEEQLRGTPGPAWFRLRDDVLNPLLKEDRFPERKGELEEMVRQVDQYEFCRSLNLTDAPESSEEWEVFRLVRRTFDRYSQGEIIEARAQLQDILQIIQADPRYAILTDFLRRTEAEWSHDRNTEARRSLLEDKCREAEQMAQTPDKAETAVQLLQATIRLYRDDAAVAAQITECEQLIDRIQTKSTSTDDKG